MICFLPQATDLDEWRSRMTIRIDKTGLVASSSPALDFADAVLRGIGQVMFQNNAFAGAIFLVGIFLNSPLFGVAALLGAVASTTTAYALGAERVHVRAGLHGFNGTLVGIALAYFLRSEMVTWVYVVAAAASSTVLTAGMTNLLGKGRPALTAPFIVVTLAFVLAAERFGALHTTGLLPTSGLPKGTTAVLGVVNESTLVNGFFKGVAEIFFQDSALTGAVLLAGLFISSRLACAAAAVGSLVGMVVAWRMGATEESIRLGLFGFNPALTAIALASVFLVLDFAAALYALLAVVVTTVLFASASAALLPIGMPALTAPFVLVTWAFLIAAPLFRRLRVR